MDFEPDEIVEKLKKNKLAIPAIGVGLAVGVFLLYKNKGSISGLGTPTDNGSVPVTVPPVPPDSGGSGGGSGGTGGTDNTSAITDLQNQITEIANGQSNLGNSFQTGLNQLSDYVNGLFGQNQNQSTTNPSDNSGGYNPNELDAIGSLINQNYQALHDMLSVPNVPDFANVSPDIHTTRLAGEISHFTGFAAVHVANQINNVVNTTRIHNPTSNPFQNVNAIAYHLGNSVRSVLQHTQIRAILPPNFNPPSVRVGSIFNRTDFDRLLGYSGASTARRLVTTRIPTPVSHTAPQRTRD